MARDRSGVRDLAEYVLVRSLLCVGEVLPASALAPFSRGIGLVLHRILGGEDLVDVADQEVDLVLVVDDAHMHAVVVESVGDRHGVVSVADKGGQQRRVGPFEIANDLSHG